MSESEASGISCENTDYVAGQSTDVFDVEGQERPSIEERVTDVKKVDVVDGTLRDEIEKQFQKLDVLLSGSQNVGNYPNEEITSKLIDTIIENANFDYQRKEQQQIETELPLFSRCPTEFLLEDISESRRTVPLAPTQIPKLHISPTPVQPRSPSRTRYKFPGTRFCKLNDEFSNKHRAVGLGKLPSTGFRNSVPTTQRAGNADFWEIISELNHIKQELEILDSISDDGPLSSALFSSGCGRNIEMTQEDEAYLLSVQCLVDVFKCDEDPVIFGTSSLNSNSVGFYTGIATQLREGHHRLSNLERNIPGWNAASYSTSRRTPEPRVQPSAPKGNTYQNYPRRKIPQQRRVSKAQQCAARRAVYPMTENESSYLNTCVWEDMYKRWFNICQSQCVNQDVNPRCSLDRSHDVCRILSHSNRCSDTTQNSNSQKKNVHFYHCLDSQFQMENQDDFNR